MKYLLLAINNIIQLAILVVPMILLLYIVYRFSKPKDYIFRKLVHSVLFLGTAYMVYKANDSLLIFIESLIIIIFWYPIFLLVENKKWYQDFFVQKSKGEIKKTLLLLYGAVIIMDLLTYLFNKNTLLIVVAILMWGVGDGLAALIGIPYGKHKIKIGTNKNKKSFEGMFAMLLSSFLIGLIAYLFNKDSLSIGSVIIASIASTITEAITSSEYDTFTVQIICIIVLLVF